MAGALSQSHPGRELSPEERVHAADKRSIFNAVCIEGDDKTGRNDFILWIFSLLSSWSLDDILKSAPTVGSNCD